MHNAPLPSQWWALSEQQIREILTLDYSNGLSTEKARKHQVTVQTPLQN